MRDYRQRNFEYYAANKDLENARCRAYHERNREKRLVVKAAWREANRDRENAKAIERRRIDPEAARQYAKQWRLTPKRQEYERQWREQNLEREKQRLRLWAQENKARCREKNAERRARKGHATPAWADLAAIAEIYAECARVSAETGIPHEVDHIIPLKGETVCGLHVHQNLRIVTRTVNRRKCHRLESEGEDFWPGNQSRPGDTEDT